MARKKAINQSTEGAADAAPSAMASDMAQDSAPAPLSARGEAAGVMLEEGLIPPPPAEAFEGLPQGPVLIRRGGKLVPSARQPYTPPPPGAGYQPGKPFGAPNADFSGYPTKAARAHNSTFNEPPHEVLEARSRATVLRQVMGQALQNLEHAYHEAMQCMAWLATHDPAKAEFIREGIDLAQVQRFADEADDVLNLFLPKVEDPTVEAKAP